VVEDIDMTEEIASVASDGRKGAALPHNTKGVEFASNILNDMGPPQALCSALLLAANAACRPSSSHCSLRSFDTNDGGAAPGSDAVSDVVAHLDTVCLFVPPALNLLKVEPLDYETACCGSVSLISTGRLL